MNAPPEWLRESGLNGARRVAEAVTPRHPKWRMNGHISVFGPCPFPGSEGLASWPKRHTSRFPPLHNSHSLALKDANRNFTSVSLVFLLAGVPGAALAADTVFLRNCVRVPLGDGFNLTAQSDIDWDNRPAPGRDSMDMTYLMTVGYNR